MTKQEMMKEAHRRAKNFKGNYSACLSLAIKEINRELAVKEINEATDLVATLWVKYGKARVYVDRVTGSNNKKSCGMIDLSDMSYQVSGRGSRATDGIKEALSFLK